MDWYHRRIIDSIHTKNIGSQISYFNVLLEARANALLMSEETMNFYQYNRKIKPSEVSHFAISYMLCILNIILSGLDKDKQNEFSKAIKKATAEYCPDFKDRMKSESKESQKQKTAQTVVVEFNNFCSTQSEEEFKAEEKMAAKVKSVAAPVAADPNEGIPDLELNKSVHSNTP